MSKPGFSFSVVVMALVLVSPATEAQTPPANPPARSFALPPLEELKATRDRPLFSPSRKPDAAAEEPEPSVVEESPESLNFELTGVVMGGEVAIAILRNRDTQETVHLRQGENLEAWSIEEIAQRHVVLKQDDRQVRLELFQAKADGSDGSTPPGSLPPPVIRPNPNRLEPPQVQRSSQIRRQQQRRNMRRGVQPSRPQNR